jgi:hypothetical protein
VAAPELGKSFVSSLNDALAANVDPGTGRHLAVHHEALAIEQVEVLPRCPMRHEVGVCDQHAGRVSMSTENADRLAGLDRECLIAIETAQRRDDPVEAFPVTRCTPDTTIDDEFAGLFGNVGVEVVHQHPQRCFRQPGLRRKLRATGRANDARVVDTCHGARSSEGGSGEVMWSGLARRARATD